MWEPLEMATASRMQDMVEIRKKNKCFVTKLFFDFFGKSSFGALGVESPHGGAMKIYAVPGHPILNLEAQGAWTWIGGFIGYFLGPVVAREVLQECLTQEVISPLLFVTFLGWLVGQQAVVHVLQKTQN